MLMSTYRDSFFYFFFSDIHVCFLVQFIITDRVPDFPTLYQVYSRLQVIAHIADNTQKTQNSHGHCVSHCDLKKYCFLSSFYWLSQHLPAFPSGHLLGLHSDFLSAAPLTFFLNFWISIWLLHHLKRLLCTSAATLMMKGRVGLGHLSQKKVILLQTQ